MVSFKEQAAVIQHATHSFCQATSPVWMYANECGEAEWFRFRKENNWIRKQSFNIRVETGTRRSDNKVRKS